MKTPFDSLFPLASAIAGGRAGFEPRCASSGAAWRRALLVLATAALVTTTAAADQAAQLDPVVVVATRSERPLREIAGNVTVIARDELDDSLTTSLDNVFRYVPGIDAAGAGTRFGSEGLIIRGIGGNRVYMELDGAPLNHQFAVGSFSNATRDFVDVGTVQRIEVLHGPASALYGSSALGGVVSMWTPDPGDFGAGDGRSARCAGNSAGIRLVGPIIS